MKKQKKPSYKWLSPHIFFDPEYGNVSIHGDKIILQFIYPFISHCLKNKWINRYFFIRYSNNGYHIRLRMYGEVDKLTNFVKPVFKKKFNLQPGELTTKSRHKLISHIRWEKYIPEIERYGGQHTIKIAEECFQISSDLAFFLLSQINERKDLRLGKALITTIILFYAMSPTNYISLTEDYFKFILNKKDALFFHKSFKKKLSLQATDLKLNIINIQKALKKNTPLPHCYDVFYKKIIKIKKKLDFHINNKKIELSSIPNHRYSLIQSIILSYMHMTCNRLGLTRAEESYIAYLLANLLD